MTMEVHMRTFCNKKTVSVLFLLLSLLLFPAVSFAEYVGSFSRIEGRVDLLRAGATAVVPARQGDGVSTGDIIRTKSDGRAEILFKDDTTVTVAPETRLKIDEYTFNPDNSRNKGMLSLLRGKLRAAVSKVKTGLIPVSMGSSTFSVNTPTTVAGVRGTVFFVFFDKGITGVIFKEGNGFVYNQNMPDKIVNVSAGQATFILTDNTPPLPPRAATDAEMSQHIIDTTIKDTDTPPTDNGDTATMQTETTPVDTADTMATLGQTIGEDTSAPKTAATGVDQGPPPPVLPITETNTETLKDTIPPLITIASSPQATTNSTSGSFTITSNEPVTFTYTIDSVGVTSDITTSDTFTLDGLPEGSHTLTITATDVAGNLSTTTYSWTTDYTAPATSFTSTPASLTNATTADFTFTSSEASTYSYTLDGSAVASATGLPISTGGSHIFTVTATDAAGNSSTPVSYTWTTDYTAPTTSFTSTPASLTNATTADFTFTSSETSTYSYTLDGSAVASATGLPISTGGSHIFTVTATDAAGNSSTPVSYTWTTDYTAPVASLTPSAVPEPSNSATINVSLSSNESSTYLYRLDGGSLTSTGATLTLSGIPEGSHTVEVQATDAVGNPSSQTLAFDLTRYSLSGNFWGCIGGVTGTVSGEVAGISGQDWGGWDMTMTGTGSLTPNLTWTLYARGISLEFLNPSNIGYWIEVAPGTSNFTDKTLSGTSTFRYLSFDRVGTGTGTLTGTYDGAGNYSLTDSGSGTYTETPLAFSGNIGFDTVKFELYNEGDGIASVGHTDGGLLGGTVPSLSNPADVAYMGPYSATLAGPYMWTPVIYSGNSGTAFAPSYDNNKFWGYIGGVWEEGTIGGKLYSLYIDQNGYAGIIKGSLAGSYYPEITAYSASGAWSPPIGISTGLLQADLTDLTNSPNNTWNGINGSSGTIAGTYALTAWDADGRRDSITNQPWGIWQTKVIGNITTPITPPFTTDQWSLTTESYGWHAFFDSIIGTQTDGTLWTINSGETIGTLSGTTYAYGADIIATPMTWISVGETIGTFDPATSAWQAVQTGAWLDTNRYLAMTQNSADQAKLAQLNIPFVEVGRATLTDQGTGLIGGSPATVNMNNVIFFAYSNGAAPKIWATGDVQGTYTCSACGGGTIPVAGNGLSANFNVQTFDTAGKKWIATVNGTGGFNGSTSFQGAAAGINDGTIGGNFSGTASGVAK